MCSNYFYLPPFGWNCIRRNFLDWNNPGGNFLGGNCPGGSYPGWEFSGWKLSKWELSWVAIFRVGIIRVAIFRVGVFMLPEFQIRLKNFEISKKNLMLLILRCKIEKLFLFCIYSQARKLFRGDIRCTQLLNICIIKVRIRVICFI